MKEFIKRLWFDKIKPAQGRTSAQERRLFTNVYWDGDLPADPDYDLGQWVEDGFPVYF